MMGAKKLWYLCFARFAFFLAFRARLVARIFGVFSSQIPGWNFLHESKAKSVPVAGLMWRGPETTETIDLFSPATNWNSYPSGPHNCLLCRYPKMSQLTFTFLISYFLLICFNYLSVLYIHLIQEKEKRVGEKAKSKRQDCCVTFWFDWLVWFDLKWFICFCQLRGEIYWKDIEKDSDGEAWLTESLGLIWGPGSPGFV